MHTVIDASVLAKPAPSSWGKEWEQFLASRPPRNEAEKWVWLKMIGPPKMDWSIITGTNMWSYDLWPKLIVRFLLMTILWSSWPYFRHIYIYNYIIRDFKSQTIHVWYIYLHLVDFYGKCREIYQSLDCMGIPLRVQRNKKNIKHKDNFRYLYLDYPGHVPWKIVVESLYTFLLKWSPF